MPPPPQIFPNTTYRHVNAVFPPYRPFHRIPSPERTIKPQPAGIFIGYLSLYSLLPALSHARIHIPTARRFSLQRYFFLCFYYSSICSTMDISFGLNNRTGGSRHFSAAAAISLLPDDNSPSSFQYFCYNAEIYQRLGNTVLFYESDLSQAYEIAGITKKRFLC
jgi:hypothetical protein